MSNEPRYPDLNEKSLGEQVAELKDYIVNLHRYIRYADNNIAERNLTRTLEDKINSYVDADGVIHILDELGFDSEVGFYNYVTFHNLQTEGETFINGDNITTGTIDADLIRAGKILSTTNPNNFWDLDTGEFRLSPGNITVNQNNDTLSDYMDDTANDAVSAFENGTFATFVTDTNNSLDTKTTVYYESSSASITDPEEGDLWIDTDDNSLYRYNGATWDSVQDTDIAQALSDAADAQSTADSKIVTYAQASAPTDIPIGTLDVGDLWIDTDDSNKLYRWSGSAWVQYSDSSAANALDTSLDQAEVFKRLTNNGALQGIYMDNGNLYINASYIKAGTIDASQVTVTNIDADNINTGHVTAAYLDLKNLTIKDSQNNNTLTIDSDGNFWTSGAIENSIDYVDATALSKPTKANLINAANGYYVLKDGKWVLASDNVDWVNDNYSSLTVDDISKANANLLTKTITVDDGKLLWETTDASNNVNKVIEFSGEDYTAQGGLSTFDIDFYNYTGLDSGNNPNNWNKAGSLYSLCPSVGSNHSIVLSSTGDLIIQGGNDPSNKVNIVSDDVRINNQTIADFVVEEDIGHNGSWNYRWWNSGKLECWGRFSFTASTISSSSGSLYTTSAASVFSAYPKNGFDTVPTTTMSVESDQGLWLAAVSDSNGNTASTTKPNPFKVMKTTSRSASTTFYVDVYAIGYKAHS